MLIDPYMNDSLADLKTKRDTLNSKVKELLTQVKSERDRLRSINEKVKVLKEKRDSKNKLVKELSIKRKSILEMLKNAKNKRMEIDDENTKYEDIPEDADRLKSEINRLEWDLQTKAHSVKHEEALSIKIEKLQESFNLARTREKLKGDRAHVHSEIRKLAEELEFTQQLIVDSMHAAQKEHDEIVVLYSQIKELRSQAGPKFKEIDEIRKQADEAHAQLVGESKKMRDEKESAILEEKRKRDDERNEKEKELTELAKKLYTDFTNGKKLTSQELIIIQKYG